jgi:shikimate dehydrogenase
MPRPARLVLLGHPVAHSLSPRFQNAALRAANIPLTYEALDVEPLRLADALNTLAAQGAAGNVTIPHKESVFAACARVSPIAARVGAVNTFWTEDAALVGHNTDVGGFATAVQDAFGPPREWTVVVCGAGGSAAAVLAAIEQWPSCRAVVVSRSPARAAALVQRFASVATPARDVMTAVRGADLVVNATPLGLRDDDPVGPVDPAVLAPGTRVFDLVYRRGETAWVRAARHSGLAACDGLPMLVEQGALAFEQWFGIAPDRALMHAALRP